MCGICLLFSGSAEEHLKQADITIWLTTASTYNYIEIIGEKNGALYMYAPQISGAGQRKANCKRLCQEYEVIIISKETKISEGYSHNNDSHPKKQQKVLT